MRAALPRSALRLSFPLACLLPRSRPPPPTIAVTLQYIEGRDGNVALVEKLITTLDVDGDGHISKEEFMTLLY